MELPKINSIRSKIVKFSKKEVKISPWTNLQLMQYEEQVDNNSFEYIDKLIDDNIETSSKLTLIERKYLFIELFKLTKGNLLDIKYTCKHCKEESKTVINLEQSMKFKEIQKQIIKTKNFTFNLRKTSNYRMNLNEDKLLETLKYICSFIDSFKYKDKEYQITNLDETVNWINNEMPKNEFDLLLKEFEIIQPKIETDINSLCEYCTKNNELVINLENFLV